MTRTDDMPSGSAAQSDSSPAIGSIPVLPVYFKLRGRKALLAGGSLPAVWKAQLLVAAGAAVVVCDPAPCPEMVALAQNQGDALTIVGRNWTSADFENCALAIGALEGEDATRFHDTARGSGVPVNVIDVPALCDFQFGTIIERSPLLIGISTDGAAPVLGQALRTRIEALLPLNIRKWAQAAKDWRPDVQGRHLGFAARRRYWETFASMALDGAGRDPSQADRAACLSAALGVETAVQGVLTLVGIGPGEPDLITLRAIRSLQSADLIIHDRGVSPEILNLGRREAVRRLAIQDEVAVAVIAEELGHGRRIAWAGLGDPATSERWRSRRRLLAQRRTPFQIARGLPDMAGLGPGDPL